MISFWNRFVRKSKRRLLLRQESLWISLFLCCLLPVLSGCQTGEVSRTGVSSQSTPASRQFSELNLLMVPFGLEVDAKHSKKAVAIQVFAVKPGKAKGSPILQGELEVELFDGFYQPDNREELPLIKTWKYSPEELKPLSKESLLGVGYQLLLVWEDEEMPAQKKVTVRALYHDPNGSTIASDLGVIPLNI